MRVFEESPDVLVVRETPWGFRAILIGAAGILAFGLHENWAEMHGFLRAFMGAFIALLGLIACKVALDVTARFDRRAGRIGIVRRGPFGAREETWGLGQFLRARVEESKDSDGSTFRLVLVFSQGAPAKADVPFTSYFSGGERAPAAAAAAINAWMGVATP